MIDVYIYIVLAIFGLVMGSFAGASVWRLRARQLVLDKRSNDKVDSNEYKKLSKLSKRDILSDRSCCLDCGYVLKWYDMIPVVSWLWLSGRCRQCNKPIGVMEPMIEIGLAVFFVLSFALWPNEFSGWYDILQFAIWLAAGVSLAILFVYDFKWFLLPDLVNYIVIVLGVAWSIAVLYVADDMIAAFMSIIGSVAILSGIYWVLYKISNGNWVGYGDIKLGLGLALILADWKLAFIALFSANLFGCIIVIPGLLSGKLKRDSKVPFGPLLIAGFVFAGLFGQYVISSYYGYLV